MNAVNGDTNRTSWWLFFFAALSAAGCSGSDAPSAPADIGTVGDPEARFESWRASLPFDEKSGYYVVEGDIPVPRAKLRYYYEQNAANPSALAEHTVSKNGQPVSQTIWDTTTRKNLTYCISPAWIALYGPSGKTAVVNAVAAAANAWQSATSNAVVFRYVPSEDNNCNSSNNNVLFNVDLLNTNAPCFSTGANCGFFPDQTDFPRSMRVLYFNSGFVGVPAANQTTIATHELGHILGFAHEQSWLLFMYKFDCGESEFQFFPLTRYDNNSIMHYSPCKDSTGKNWAGPNADSVLSIYDKRGAQCAYQGKCEWSQLSPANTVVDIDISQTGVIWSVSDTTKDSGGYYVQQWTGSAWSRLTNSAAPGAWRIAVDSASTPWWITRSGKIYHWVNNTAVQVSGTSASDISASRDGSIWVLGSDGGTWKFTGFSFVSVPGMSNGISLSVDSSGNPFVIKSDFTIWHYEGGTFKQWPGYAIDIDAGSNGAIWVVGTNGYIYQWDTTAGAWALVTGAGARIAVAQNGQPWVVGSDYSSWIDVWVP